MKLNINKACDLSSISVLPPHSRRANAIPSGTDSSVFGKSQASQLRSLSQQSFSQGMSLSQLSQNSFEEIVTNEQKFGSQERDNSTKRISCLAPIAYAREESQMPVSRSSNNVVRRWNSASVPDHRCQVSEELEHRIGLMETSLNRLGMILDSVQSDVMQVNKGVKEVSLEMESIRQKMIVHDDTLQTMLKGEDDIKASLDGSLKLIPDQLKNLSGQCKFQEIFTAVSALPDKIELHLSKLQNELSWAFTKKMEAMARSMKSPENNPPVPTIHPPQRRSCRAIQSQKQQLQMIENPIVPSRVNTRRALIPKTEARDMSSLKTEPATSAGTTYYRNFKQEETPLKRQEHNWRIIIESDEEIDGGFSCLFEEKETGKGTNSLMEEATEETKRILRKARRKRKCPNNVILV